MVNPPTDDLKKIVLEEVKVIFTLENIHDYDKWTLGSMANELIDEITPKHVRFRLFTAEYRNRSNKIHHYITTIVNNRRNALKKEEAEMNEKSEKSDVPKKLEDDAEDKKVEAKNKDTFEEKNNPAGRKRLRS